MEEVTRKFKKSVLIRQRKEQAKAQADGASTAKLMNCPTSPRKMRLVADLIRGEKVERALYILKYSEKAVAARLEKLLLSCINNCEQDNADESVQESQLNIKEIRVDVGRMLKRMRPAAQGHGNIIRKRSNHVTLVIDSLKNKDN